MYFVKRALEEKKKSWMPATLGALAAGAGTYGLLRRGKVTGLNPFQQHARRQGLAQVIDKKAPKTQMGQALDRVRFGADKVYYTPARAKAPAKPKKAKEALVYQQDYGRDHVRGKKELGVSTIDDSKRKEMRIIERLGPKATQKNVFTGEAHKGQGGLKKLHNSMKGENYFIKPDEGFASGVGGGGFINSKDVKQYLEGGKLDAKKRKMIKEFMKSPSEFIAQKDMGIAKDKLTKATKEFRVHAAGDKVLRGASSPRSKNLLNNPMDKIRAEKFLQEHIKNLPKKHRSNMIAADVAKTKDGKFKIVELNMGASSSGLLDPDYIKKKFGSIPALEAIRKNQAVYRGLTGRSSRLDAGVKGLGATAASGAGLSSMNQGPKKEGG
jgi:hypothetical protein